LSPLSRENQGLVALEPTIAAVRPISTASAASAHVTRVPFNIRDPLRSFPGECQILAVESCREIIRGRRGTACFDHHAGRPDVSSARSMRPSRPSALSASEISRFGEAIGERRDLACDRHLVRCG